MICICQDALTLGCRGTLHIPPPEVDMSHIVHIFPATTGRIPHTAVIVTQNRPGFIPRPSPSLWFLVDTVSSQREWGISTSETLLVRIYVDTDIARALFVRVLT